jgi:hypothetical protein
VVDEAKVGATRLPDFRKMMRTINQQEEGTPQTSEAAGAEVRTSLPSLTVIGKPPPIIADVSRYM